MSERADLAQMVEDRVNGMMEDLERLRAIEAAARELAAHEEEMQKHGEWKTLEMLIDFSRKIDELRKALGEK